MAKTNETTNKVNTPKKEFNPTITAMFPNAKFGDGAMLSVAIDGKAYDTIQQKLQIGSKLLLKPRKSSAGRDMAYLEILPPFETNESGI